MSKIPFGPTYDEMLNPSHQDPEVRKKALKAKQENELDPINLFNITPGKMRRMKLTKSFFQKH